MTTQKRIEWTVLGRVIGTATGWDQADTFVIGLYDFEPAENVKLPETDCLWIDFESGTAQTFDEGGNVETSHDIVAALAPLPIKESN